MWVMVPPGNGSTEPLAENVAACPWVIVAGLAILAVGFIGLKPASPRGVPTPVGPSKPGAAWQARVPALRVGVVPTHAQSTMPWPRVLGGAPGGGLQSAGLKPPQN